MKFTHPHIPTEVSKARTPSNAFLSGQTAAFETATPGSQVLSPAEAHPRNKIMITPQYADSVTEHSPGLPKRALASLGYPGSAPRNRHGRNPQNAGHSTHRAPTPEQSLPAGIAGSGALLSTGPELAHGLRYSSLILICLTLASCAVGPNHTKPDVTDITPAKWKWKSAAPRDDAPKGQWWTVFKDHELNRLEALAVASNNDLRAALARFDQASATTRVAGAAFSPDVRLNGAAQRERTSGNLPTPVPVNIPSAQINSFNVPLQLSYELDFWGRIRRLVESAKAESAGSSADYQTALLSLTGEVASSYFQLCALDTELAALHRTLDLREKSVGIIEQRFKAGVLPEVDDARARSELATTKAEMADVKRQREELVAVLALLCGQPASTFTIAQRGLSTSPPSIPSGMPSDLLERRPDIASAERKVAARSAQIGAEIANFFPAIRLTGEGGYLSKDTGSLFSADSRVWSIGPSISLPISGFFVTKAKVNRAKAAHAEAIASYRQAVLTAIKDVETSLTQIHYRGEQSKAQAEAVAAATRAADLVRSRYESGAVSYLELLDAERTSLLLERQAAQVKAQRMISTVRLIKAIGGKW